MVVILSRCIHASTAQNCLIKKVICYIPSEKYTNAYYGLSVRNVKKNLKENRILRDINAPAAFDIGVVLNSNFLWRKKVTVPWYFLSTSIVGTFVVPVPVPRHFAIFWRYRYFSFVLFFSRDFTNVIKNLKCCKNACE